MLSEEETNEDQNAILYGALEFPNSIRFEEVSQTTLGSNPGLFSGPNCARFVAEPFERGYGHTVGNAMRRMLLTSIEAPAIVSVRIEGVAHEYMAVDGIVEDMTNIVLNFKQALLRKLPSADVDHSRETRQVTTVINVTKEQLEAAGGQKTFCLGDLVKGSHFEVINPQLPIFTVTSPCKRQVDLRVSHGRGYVPSERHSVRDKVVDEIIIDSIFSPVRLVNYYVENCRVGQDTDYDRLILEVKTDGRVTPKEAVSFAAQIGIKHFKVFERIQTHSIRFASADEVHEANDDDLMAKLCLRISEIELSVRSTNCLNGANIETIGELVVMPEAELLKFRNFGKKSLNEIKEKLSEMSLSLGMDLARYGITPANAKDSVRELQMKRAQAAAPVAAE